MEMSSPDADADATTSGARSPTPQLHASPSTMAASSPAASPSAAAAAAPGDAKRTGRPAHPLWAHFHRGEKRNRYHHHAFCVYCVARYGAAHVAPTRGVSVDMLRHVEKCPNCPSRVLESVRAICGRRDAVRFDRLLRKKATTTASALASPSSSVAAAAAASETPSQEELGGEDAEHAQVVSDTESDGGEQLAGSDQPSGGQRRTHVTASGASASRSSSDAAASTLHGASDARLLGKHVDREAADARDGDALPTAKRLRAHSPRAAMAWKVQLLKAAVTVGLPLQALESATIRELLRHLRPRELAAAPSRTLAGLSEPQFLADASRRLAGVQLDRVKEGMHNSTIKGGLTLSVNCWRTLDLQQVVAFTLVNSNGDAACVQALDMGTQARAYSAAYLAVKIDEVLERLEAQDIRVMGIVADSTVALNAARCVCLAAKRRALMVVPCFARQLGVLAGSLLTHERFRGAVGQMVEVAAYFSSASLQRVLKLVSGGDDAYIPLPNRVNWHSFVDCVGAMLKYCDVVTAICSADGDGASGLVDGAAVPHRLKDLVFADQGKLWKTLQELHTLLLPLKESYALVFEPKPKASDSAPSPHEKPPTESAAAHGLTLAHIMYQLARMNQQYAGLVGSHQEALAQTMQARVRTVWQRYDFPVLLLAYVFNFHLDTALLNAEHEGLRWTAIAAYFQAYFSTWFQSERAAGDGEEEPPPPASSAALAPISADKVREIFSAYKTKQFPFDADTTSDYVDVSSFYSFVSDSHPEICALCCRMYAISLLSANVQRFVRGVGFVATSAQSTKDPKTVELLLHVGFASSTARVQHAPSSESEAADDDTAASSSAGSISNSTSSSEEGGIAALSTVLGGFHPDEMFWSEDVWDDFADDWHQFVELELSTDEFDAISEHTLAHARASESSSVPVVEMMSRKVPLDEVFVGTLAPLVASDGSSAKAAAAATGVFADESEL